MRERRVAAGEAFWRFSLAFYARPGVAAALLDLQDRGGFDVNLILWLVWQGAVGGRVLTLAEIGGVETEIASLRQRVVEPLRTLRRALKSDSEPAVQQLRQRIAGIELAAEREVQRRLVSVGESLNPSGTVSERLRSAETNLALYLGPEQAVGEAASTLRAALADFLQR